MSAGQRLIAWCDARNAAHPVDHNGVYQRWLLRQVPARFGRALDVGCGTGGLARRLGERAYVVDAVDLDQHVIDAARSRRSAVDHVRFHRADFMSTDLLGRYDVITVVAVLHHVPLEAGLQRLRHLLAPGGTLVVLGLYRERTVSDRALSALAIAANLILGAVVAPRRAATRPLPMTAPTAPATTTLAEIRDAAGLALPGAVVRRRLLWRYSLVYHRPRAGSDGR